MEKVAWFYFEDYITTLEANFAIERLVRIIEMIRGYEEFKPCISRVIKSPDKTVVEKIEIEGVGLTEEFTEERLKIIYENGKVEVFRL